MKKILCFVLIISSLLSLTACDLHAVTQNPETTTQSTPSSDTTPETAETEPQIMQHPMISIAVPITDDITTTETGATIFISRHQENISLIVPDPEVADNIIIDLFNRIDSAQTQITDIKYLAAAKYDNTPEWTPYLNQITYDPKRLDSSILSMLGIYTIYDGDIHPETAYLPVNYDLLTGNTLAFTDILTENASPETITQLVIDALQPWKEQKKFYETYEQTVASRFTAEAIQSEHTWFFSQNGLCFYFAPYDIAPYVSGMIIAEIPYAQLTGILKDAFFPPEREKSAGTIQAEIFKESALSKYEQFSEVVLSEDGQKILLHADQPIYDLRIETGTWSKKGTVFTPNNTLYAAYYLDQSDAVMLSADFETTQPSLRLSYTTGDETIYAYITADNQSVTLIDCAEDTSA